MSYQNDITVLKTVLHNGHCNNIINNINYYNYLKYCGNIICSIVKNPNNADVVSDCNLKLMDIKYDK